MQLPKQQIISSRRESLSWEYINNEIYSTHFNMREWKIGKRHARLKTVLLKLTNI